MEEDLLERTFRFGLAVINLTRTLPNHPEAWNVRGQLSRCAPSVGANYRAARRGRSRREFLAKLGIVEEEADESVYWLRFLLESEMIPRDHIEPLLKEAKEITAIIVASRKTTKENM